MAAGVAMWLAAAHWPLRKCRDVVVGFVQNDPHELNDADLTIAKARLLPHYWDRCPFQESRTALVSYNSRLEEEELSRRSRR